MFTPSEQKFKYDCHFIIDVGNFMCNCFMFYPSSNDLIFVLFIVRSFEFGYAYMREWWGGGGWNVQLTCPPTFALQLNRTAAVWLLPEMRPDNFLPTDHVASCIALRVKEHGFCREILCN